MAPNIRLRLPAAATAAALFASVFLIAPAAHAATFDVSDEATLVQAIADANASAGPDTIVVSANIRTTTELNLEVTSPLTIDVGAHSVMSVRLRATADLTLTGDRAAGGAWHAGSSTEPDFTAAPGVGISAGNTLTVDDIALFARATLHDAGIGGWSTSTTAACTFGGEIAAGTIVIVDSTVETMSSGGVGAGIGAACLGPGTDITIVRSEIVMVGEGVGIGGRALPMSTLTLDSSTLIDVNVESTTTTLAGTNTVIGVVDFDDFAAENNGLIEVDGDLFGDAITNNGTIRPSANVTADSVAGNSFEITFDDNYSDGPPPESGIVYAPTIADAAESLPIPARAGLVIAEWNTAADGTGTPLTEDTMLSSVAIHGEVTVYAIWQEQVVLLNPSNTALTAGDDETFTVTRNEPFGESSDLTRDSTFTSSNTSDQVNRSTITFTEAGTRTITATYGTTTLTASVSARAAATSSIAATPSATSVDEGGSITLTVTGTDEYGNPTEVDVTDVVVTSDVSTDEISGLTVTFPHASSHVLTVSLGDNISTTTTIEVIPTPAPALLPATGGELPATGGEVPATPLVAGVILTLLGAAVLALTAHRRIRLL
ncbi:hypothetical protein ACWPKO_25600 (plasmid) [Coraliomargarita sp. W4R53]